MAASVRVLSYHGSGPTSAAVQGANVRHKRADNDDVDLNSALPIPGDGITPSYSWRKHTKIEFLTTPSSIIRNLQWYLDALPDDLDPARNWDGIRLYAGKKSSYTQASITDQNGLISGLVDADTAPYNVSSPLMITSGTVLVNPNTGTGTQDFMVTQMSCESTALPGEKAPRPSFYRFDEV